jgi:serine phosphatase RsbU (regulator of sigma subunit)
MPTKNLQADIDDLLARVGKPSVALQLKIDQLRGGITEGEVMTILLKDADVVRTKIETELLCLVSMARQLEIKEQREAARHADLEWVEKVKRSAALSNENREPQSKQKEFFNLVKVTGFTFLVQSMS